jgi:hypothetical protein
MRAFAATVRALATPPADARAELQELVDAVEAHDKARGMAALTGGADQVGLYIAADRKREAMNAAARALHTPPAAPATSGEGREDWTGRFPPLPSTPFALPKIGAVYDSMHMHLYALTCHDAWAATPSPSDAADKGVLADVRRAAERTRDDLSPEGRNYPDIRTLLAFVEQQIAARAADNGEKA